MTRIKCVKSVPILSHSGPYFPSFGLNTDQNNSEYRHFSSSDCSISLWWFKFLKTALSWLKIGKTTTNQIWMSFSVKFWPSLHKRNCEYRKMLNLKLFYNSFCSNFELRFKKSYQVVKKCQNRKVWRRLSWNLKIDFTANHS